MQRLSRRQAVLAILLVGAIGFFIYALRSGRPVGRPAASGRGSPAAQSGGVAAEQKLRPAAPADADFRRYASLASSGIFSERKPSVAPQPKRGGLAPLPPFKRVTGPVPPVVPPAPNLTGWSYAGYVALDGEELGVVQNDSTMSCEYLAVGDRFMGAEVESLDRESIRLRSGASTTSLSRPRDFSVEPLGNAQAGARPQPPGPGD
jgi:hypothetical protein